MGAGTLRKWDGYLINLYPITRLGFDTVSTNNQHAISLDNQEGLVWSNLSSLYNIQFSTWE